ncbi:FecR domain-containing protein [Carboxylicivirga sediminis]|uniref:FecR domain-containing protein n=1 Tax=Carboxylicivirga sediminis TaxID=2006564 RepID=A0A941F2X5_9BACT|nr:FecR domain-containing protein [Carboxylicivirga sediminis]MBR8534775.1 FecR domain-containing protein [Carboxylicivirga sediminis]
MDNIEEKYRLLAKQLNGELTDTEHELLTDELKQDETLVAKQHVLQMFWQKFFPKVKSQSRERIMTDTMKRVMGVKDVKRPQMTIWYSAVAILVVALGISLAWNLLVDKNNELIQYVANVGEIKKVVLPDGTKVDLNAGSSLVIQKDFTADKRQVILSGEGYFDVAKDADKPFEITTSHLKVSVLGTKFDLKAYADEDEIKAVLDEGKIQLDGEFNKQQPVFLKPGYAATLNKKTGELQIQPHKQQIAEQWRDGKLVFYNHTMAEIVRILERRFNARIIILNDEVKAYRFSGDFSNANLFELLGFLSAARPFTFETSGEYIVISK